MLKTVSAVAAAGQIKNQDFGSHKGELTKKKNSLA